MSMIVIYSSEFRVIMQMTRLICSYQLVYLRVKQLSRQIGNPMYCSHLDCQQPPQKFCFRCYLGDADYDHITI